MTIRSGVYSIRAAHPEEFPRVAVLLTVRLSGILGGRRAGAGCFEITGYGRASVRVLLPFAGHGWTRRTTLGGLPSSRRYCSPRYESVLVPTLARGHGSLFGSSPEGYVWVLSVALSGRNASGMAVSQMGDDRVRSGLSNIGRMMVSAM